MCGGGKTQTTNQTSTNTPAGLAQLQDIYNRVSQVASTPYSPYGGQMTAGLTDTQNAGIAGINAAQGAASPYFNQAADYARTGAAPISDANIQRYQSPYTQQVIDATQANFRQDNAIGQQQVIGNAAAKGALGGDRVGVAQAELARQQGLAQNPVIAGLRNQGFTQALGAAQQDRAAAAQGAYTFGALAPSVQNAQISGAQAQIGAGGLQQGTNQAGLTAAYNQYLQGQAFPYQQAGFLASAGMPAVAGMGGTSTGQTSTPGPSPWGQVAGLGLTAASMFSDERIKKNKRQIGKTFDGQPIFSFTYGDDPHTHIGLMAQEVEKKHPEAVGEVGGIKTVDYAAATDDAAGRRGFADGGPVNFMDVQTYIPKFGGMQSASPYGSAPSLNMSVPQRQADTSFTPQQLTSAANGLKGLMPDTDNYRAAMAQTGPTFAGDGMGAMGGVSFPIFGQAAARGGRIRGYRSGGSVNRSDRFANTVHMIRQTLRGGGVVNGPGGYASGGVADSGNRGIADLVSDRESAQQARENAATRISRSVLRDPILVGGSHLTRLEAADYAAGGVAGTGNRGVADILSDREAAQQARENAATRLSRSVLRDPVLTGGSRLSGIERPGYADGGEVGFNDRFNASYDFPAPKDIDPTALQDSHFAQFGAAPESFAGAPPIPQAAIPMPRPRPDDAPSALPPIMTADMGQDPEALPDDASAFARPKRSPYALPPAPAPTTPISGMPPSGAPEPAKSQFGSFNPFNLSDDARMGLMSAGLGMMASKSPFALTQIGEGGQSGIKTYGDRLNHRQQVESQARQLAQQASQFAQNLGLHRDQLAENARHHGAVESMAQKPTLTVIGRDEYGNPKYGIFNPRDQSVKPVPAQGNTTQFTMPDGTPAPEAVKPPVPPPAQLSEDTELPKNAMLVSGDDAFLRGLPEGDQKMVKAMVEGRQPPPPGKALATPYWRRMVELATTYDPGFDMGRWSSRVQTRKNFNTGVEGRAIRSLNTVANHLDEVDEAGQALNNFKTGSFGPLTKTANDLRTAYKTHEDDPKLRRFNTAADAVSTELEKAFRGSQTAISGIREWRKNLSSAASPESMKEANKTLAKLLMGQLEGFGEQYSRGMGANADPLTLLGPKAAKTFQKLLGTLPDEAGGEAKPNEPKIAAPSGIQRPATVPAGSQYSPSRKMWRDPGGKIYDIDGNPVQ